MRPAWPLACLLAAVAAGAAEPAKPTADFRLLDRSGRSHRLSSYVDREAVVVVARSARCDAFSRAQPLLARLRDLYEPRGVAFLSLDGDGTASEPPPPESAGPTRDIPVLLDPSGVVTRSLGARRALDAFVILPRDRALAWRGDVAGLEAALGAVLERRAPPASVPEGAPECPLAQRDRAAVSYAQAAGVLRARCAGCHWDASGPAPMVSHAKVRGWAPMIREVLLAGRMPPWTADPHHGRFSSDISLSSAQLRTLVDWLDAGAAWDEGPDLLAADPPGPPQRWPLGAPDMVLRMSQPAVIPASGTFSWQYYDLMGPLEEDLWLRGAHVNPGNFRVAHHVFLYDFPGPFWEYKDDERNWKSGGMSAIRPAGVVPIWNWTPGRQPARLPPGTGVRVRKGRYLVLEMHYTPSGREETDLTEVGLYLHKSTASLHEMRVARLNKTDIVIPAGAREHVVGPQLAFRFTQDSRLVGLRPHMHARGTRMRAVARFPDGREETLLSVPVYDFNWQHLYLFSEPRFMPAGTELYADGAYDNSVFNPANPDPTRDVPWGMRSRDEMFFLWVHYYTEPSRDKPSK